MANTATGSQVQPQTNDFLLLAKSTNSSIISNLLSTISYKKDQVRILFLELNALLPCWIAYISRLQKSLKKQPISCFSCLDALF